MAAFLRVPRSVRKCRLICGCICGCATLFPALRAASQAPDATDRIVAELRQSRSAEALRDAQAALRERPRDARLWILKGVAAQQLGQTSPALAAFEAALGLAPTSLPALEGAAEIAFRTGRPEARSLVERILQQVPENPEANGMAAMLDVGESQWAAAAAHFGKAGSAIATQKVALNAEALALDHLGRDAEAEAVVGHILEVWPEDKDARYNLAVLASRQKQFPAALATLQPLLTAHDEAALSLAATVEEALGDTPQAVELLRSAIGQKPKDPQNYLDFAALSFDHSSFAAGITMLNAGLTQLPASAALHVARGALYMGSDQLAAAEQDFETANQLDPSQSFGLEAQGLTAIQRHNLPEALEKVQASLRTDPHSAYLHYLAAEILKEGGAAPGSAQAEEAIRYAQRATALDPKLVPALDLLSGLEFQAERFGEAAQQCRAALVQNPMDQEALFRLVLTLRRTGDKDKEIPGLVERLKQARVEEHTAQVRLDKYRLSAGPATPAAP